MAAIAVLFAITLVAGAPSARACGVVARSRPAAPGRDPYATLPYLAIEQTLIVWDRASRTEDFVREARFARTSEPFGFVVPVPGKPEVSKVDSPFPTLRKEYPYTPPPSARRSTGSGAPGGAGGAKKAPEPELEVLSVQRVGSFDVTVLRASEPTALDGWLAKNGFEMTEPAKPWLAHYVDLRFYFVAFRYAGAPAGAADGMTSETVRIRFETGAPYYPYLEPELAPGAPIPQERMLAVWLVTEDPMLPIVSHTKNGAWTWETPWVPTLATSALTVNFLARVPAVESGFLIRSKNLHVQPFLDMRTSRIHLGDAVFGYRTSHDLGRDDVAALAPLLPALDARIPRIDADGAKRLGCSLDARTSGVGEEMAMVVLAIAGVAVIALRRRRGGKAVLALALLVAGGSGIVACGARRAKVADANQNAVVELLSGRPPYTLKLSRHALVVSDVELGAPKVDREGVDSTSAIADARAALEACLGPGMPPSLEIHFATDARGRCSYVTSEPSAERDRVAHGCLRQALGDKVLVSPPAEVKIQLHATFAQQVVDAD
ncbi:MAG: DUF2330 domain-containing protein [Deltaproteobacteria bacterium]|nr:DUF2330 domain-containing protein [Deltaproteobacteria bacterium]